MFAGLGSLLLFGARAAEDATHHVVIPLMAGELDHRLVACLQFDQGGPRFRPRRRIVDRQLLIQRARTGPRETLDQMQPIG